MARQDPRRERFDAFKLAASRGELQGAVKTPALERLEDQLAEAGGEIRWSIRGGGDPEGRPAITVAIEGSVPLVCQRCLGALDQPVSQSTTLLLARDNAELAKLDASSEHEVLLASAPLDPVALVEDELLLTLPFAPRHEAACGAPVADEPSPPTPLTRGGRGENETR